MMSFGLWEIAVAPGVAGGDMIGEYFRYLLELHHEMSERLASFLKGSWESFFERSETGVQVYICYREFFSEEKSLTFYSFLQLCELRQDLLV